MSGTDTMADRGAHPGWWKAGVSCERRAGRRADRSGDLRRPPDGDGRGPHVSAAELFELSLVLSDGRL
jgi:hypothetical protein